MNNIKGLVFCGYPCVGKSSIGGTSIQMPDGGWTPVVDMETSLMRTEDYERPENWVQIYVNYVETLINQGINVFTSTHGAVREELKKRGIEYVNVMPSLNIKDYWLCKLRDRWKKDPSQKNLLAYERAMDYYDVDIKGLQEERYVEINVERPYDLNEVICNYIRYNRKIWTFN